LQVIDALEDEATISKDLDPEKVQVKLQALSGRGAANFSMYVELRAISVETAAEKTHYLDEAYQVLGERNQFSLEFCVLINYLQYHSNLLGFCLGT
jgi:hypothetical protein